MTRRLLFLLLILLATSVLAPRAVVSQDETPATKGPSPDELRRVGDAVFSEAAFEEGLDTTHLTIDELGRLVGHAIDWVYNTIAAWLLSIQKRSPLLFGLLLIGMLVVLGLLLYHIGWTFSRAFRGVGSGDEQETDAERGERVRRYRDLRSEASQLANEGDPREGVRLLLLALLALLAQEEVLLVARSWTPREIVARLATRGSFGDDLKRFGVAVEDALYTEHAVTRAAFDSCEQTLEALTGGLRGGARVSG
jgi:hypothetical protein